MSQYTNFVRLRWRPQDFYIGAFIDTPLISEDEATYALYICVIPTVCVHVKWTVQRKRKVLRK